MLQEKIDKLPRKSGVYIFKNSEGESIYIGKARSLKDRVSSYFTDAVSGPKTKRMINEAAGLEVIETESEVDAILLESDLIKRIKPKYNVAWRDDKSFPYIKVTWNEDFPRVFLTREVKKDRSKYVGPFTSPRTARAVLRMARKVFPYCNVRSKNKRACLYYHLGLCPGVCRGDISRDEYRKIIKGLVGFLSGKKLGIIKDLEKKMKAASRLEDFERAQEYKSRIQKIDFVTQSFKDPQEYIENPNLVEDLREKELGDLKDALGLLSTPQRVEAFDVSNISGKLAAVSMVVFENGDPRKSDYRKFRIKFSASGRSDEGRKDTPDDTAMIYEALLRRFKRLEKEDKTSFGIEPDLILIDGGRGQLSAALKAQSEIGIKVPVIALAKRSEEIYIPGQAEPIRLERSCSALKLLQRIRDEAHRFALSYHRNLRKRYLVG